MSNYDSEERYKQLSKLVKSEKRLKKLEAAIKQLADAKGRHNTAIAYARLMKEFQHAE